jgi:hypothetical protein
VPIHNASIFLAQLDTTSAEDEDEVSHPAPKTQQKKQVKKAKAEPPLTERQEEQAARKKKATSKRKPSEQGKIKFVYLLSVCFN